MANVFILGLLFVILFTVIVFASGYCVGIYILTKKYKILKDYSKINTSFAKNRNVENNRFQDRQGGRNIVRNQRRTNQVLNRDDRAYSYIATPPYNPPMRNAILPQSAVVEPEYIEPVEFVEQNYYDENEQTEEVNEEEIWQDDQIEDGNEEE